MFIHHFWNDEENPLHASGEGGSRSEPGEDVRVHDRDILKLVKQTLDHKTPRDWYFALMDYGSYLGKIIENPNKKSRHYAKQSKFKGSDREIRGKILGILLEKKKVPLENLMKKLKDLSQDQDRIEKIIDGLEAEGFVELKNGNIFIKK